MIQRRTGHTGIWAMPGGPVGRIDEIIDFTFCKVNRERARVIHVTLRERASRTVLAQYFEQLRARATEIEPRYSIYRCEAKKLQNRGQHVSLQLQICLGNGRYENP